MQKESQKAIENLNKVDDEKAREHMKKLEDLSVMNDDNEFYLGKAERGYDKDNKALTNASIKDLLAKSAAELQNFWDAVELAKSYLKLVKPKKE